MQNKRQTGAAYEQHVAQYLREQGYEILEMNFRSKFGEIDLIAKQKRCIVFVEVKYRGNAEHGYPAEAVHPRKRRRISNTASYYLYSHHYPVNTPCRFDVAAVSQDTIHLITNAFQYEGNFRC